MCGISTDPVVVSLLLLVGLFRGLVLLWSFFLLLCNTFNLLCSSARSHNRVCLFRLLVGF